MAHTGVGYDGLPLLDQPTPVGDAARVARQLLEVREAATGRKLDAMLGVKAAGI